jgi:hypothetical protein
MAGRKRKPDPDPELETFDLGEQPATAPAAAAAEPELEAVPVYRTGTWAGLDNFECLRCPFATTEEPRIRAHVAREHP